MVCLGKICSNGKKKDHFQEVLNEKRRNEMVENHEKAEDKILGAFNKFPHFFLYRHLKLS